MTEYLPPDGPCDRLNLRLEGERVGERAAGGQVRRKDQREGQGRAAVCQQRTSENPAEGLVEQGFLPNGGTVAYREIRIRHGRDNDKMKRYLRTWVFTLRAMKDFTIS